MLLLLIDHGVHLNIPDMKGRTPLHIASQNNDIDIVRILIDNKVNPFIQNKEGKKPIDLANNTNLKEMLREYMDVISINLASRADEFEELFQDSYN
jgi:ankyrin repeat protein